MIVAAVPFIAVPVIAVIAVLAVIFILIKACWKVAEPNEALIISGFGVKQAHSEAPSFKIVTGKGALVWPGLQTVRKLQLITHKADIALETVTNQGLAVQVRAVVVYKVGKSEEEISNAASRFLGKEQEMVDTINEVFAGHLRSIIGTMTMEDIIRDRESLATQTRESAGKEMEGFGLHVDSLQIAELDDKSGYIENLAAPHRAAVERDARVAKADAEQVAAQKEQETAQAVAEATSKSAIRQAEVEAEANTAKAKAAQAGPLAEAEARKAVVVQETEVAELEARNAEQRLQAEKVKPAEAERDARIAAATAEAREIELRAEANAKKVKIEGEAQAAVTKLTGEADAAKIAATLGAEAEGIEKRAAALEKNANAVIQSAVVEKLPEIVRAAGESLAAVDHMIVLNGAEGVGGMLGQVASAGVSLLPLVQGLLGKETTTGNGDTVVAAPVERAIVAAPVAAETTELKPLVDLDELGSDDSAA